MKNSRVLDVIAAILLVVGGLNWGLVGLFKMDLIGSVFGDMSGLTRIIFVLVGLSAVYRIVCMIRCKSCCK